MHLASDTTAHCILARVTQDSVLGLLLSTLYTCDIGLIMDAHGLLHHCYAKAMQLYFFLHAVRGGCTQSQGY